MATVELDYLYIHDGNDTSTFLTFDLDAESASTEVAGDVRRLASGRRRAVVTQGHDKRLPVRLDLVSRASREALEAWVEEGKFLMLREPRGRVLWGRILGLDVEEINVIEDCTIQFTFEAVTYSEEV